MATKIAGLPDNAVPIPGAVNYLDADGSWDRSDPTTNYVAQERPTSVAKSYGWNDLRGKTVQLVTVVNGTIKVFPPDKPLAGITSPTFQRAQWTDGLYVYEIK